MFRTESDLVSAFVRNLLELDLVTHSSQNVPISFEFNYSSGRTDIVILAPDNGVIAFEAKLTKWRDALQQAYRNKCFSVQSYVVMPEDTAARAADYTHEFRRRGVGLYGVSHKGLKLFLEAPRESPIQPKLTRLAREYIHTQKDVNAKKCPILS